MPDYLQSDCIRQRGKSGGRLLISFKLGNAPICDPD